MLKAKVKLGNCLDVLKRFPDGTVDCIVTDPPYGLTPVSPRGKKTKASGGFMAAKWDVDVPSTKIWRECLRVLKPGAFAFIMCSPRQDCLAKLILRLRKAGFVIGYTSIYWIHGQGFGKAKNISKHLDKKAGAKREVVGVSSRPNSKPGGYEGARYKEKRHTRFGVVQDQPDQSLPVTEEAKRLNGSYAGYQPRPNLENVVVVMKPITESTYIDQTLANGKGCTWLDDCRIPIATEQDAKEVANKNQHTKFGSGPRTHNVYGDITKIDRDDYDPAKGRVPANVLVQDDALRGEQNNTVSHFPKHKRNWHAQTYHTYARNDEFKADSGSVSRYFDLDAWFADRIGDLPESAQATFPFLYVAKPSRREKNTGLEGRPEKINDPTALHRGRRMAAPSRIDGAPPTKMANHHPTVKAVKLMHYLVTLGSRPHDVVLDPFCGSGTTGVAAVNLRRNFFGIELDPEYVEIARARIRHAIDNPPKRTDKPINKQHTKPPKKAETLWGDL